MSGSQVFAVFAIQSSFNIYLPQCSALGRHSGEGVRPHRGWGRAQNGVTGQLLGALRVGLGGRPCVQGRGGLCRWDGLKAVT